MGISIRMAGFEIRDSIGWVYGSGFPKSLDVSKAIDKAAGAEREVIGQNQYATRRPQKEIDHDQKWGKSLGTESTTLITAPSTPEAKQWQGWGTALKPALEPIVVARKPLIGTVAENVLTHGTGGLNIDASRIGTTVETWPASRSYAAGQMQPGHEGQTQSTGEAPNGRWPANLILDEYTAELLDEQSGITKGSGPGTHCSKRDQLGNCVGHDNAGRSTSGQTFHSKNSQSQPDSGGASRFFYVAKASKRDRNEGLEDLPAVRASAMGYDIGLGEAGEGMFKDRNPQKQNFHPTVKPTALMQYLVKLVTPPGGTVLDPFTGSGSTGKAAILEGFDFIGIELTEDYWPIIERRLKHAEGKVAEAKENQEAEPQGLF
jgi:site-specific DNA-methyltransferase (adenine-specific)